MHGYMTLQLQYYTFHLAIAAAWVCQRLACFAARLFQGHADEASTFYAPPQRGALHAVLVNLSLQFQLIIHLFL
jgi:hypothetical protein